MSAENGVGPGASCWGTRNRRQAPHRSQLRGWSRGSQRVFRKRRFVQGTHSPSAPQSTKPASAGFV